MLAAILSFLTLLSQVPRRGESPHYLGGADGALECVTTGSHGSRFLVAWMPGAGPG